MSYVTADDIAGKLEGAKRSSGGWTARCPSHDDRHASLKVSEGQRATVLYCHAGCATDDVLGALALDKAQLFHDYGVKDWRDRNQINEAMRQMIAKHRPYSPDTNLYRLDDLMWDALRTDKLPDDVWYNAMCWAGINWPLVMGSDWTEARMYPTVLRDGPLFDFLQPLWEHLDRPNWHQLADHALRKMRDVWNKKGGRRDGPNVTDLDMQLTGGPLL